ncbi:MAG: alpha-amylase family glycosyl hydrolase [Candidatus Sericytochromatia bacterium]
MFTHPWAATARFYHLYPLGCCGAPARLESLTPRPRLDQLHGWIEHLVSLGVNAVYLGPLFMASSHGYDTVDYYRVDPRLGDEASLRGLVRALHARGIRVVLDGVFNHVGRDFWAFRDLRAQLQHSPYRDWFQRLSFARRGRSGDPFSYQGWKGHHELVKLKLSTPAVKRHLLGAVEHWIREYEIDGLRLDAADCMSLGFLRQLGQRARRLKPGFWLLGEVVHGDYRRWIEKGQLDSVTNYALYDALHTSHNQWDYTRLAQTLQHQFGPHGVYRDLRLYHFVDNHDVTRIASLLRFPAQLYPLHILLYTLPGIPSLYYGSEWGQTGRKRRHSDAELRPAIAQPFFWQPKAHPDLQPVIARLAQLHAHSRALQSGSWQLLKADGHTLVYARHAENEHLVVAVNLADQPHRVSVQLPWHHGQLVDRLNPGAVVGIHQSTAQLDLSPTWGRVLHWQRR